MRTDSTIQRDNHPSHEEKWEQYKNKTKKTQTYCYSDDDYVYSNYKMDNNDKLIIIIIVLQNMKTTIE